MDRNIRVRGAHKKELDVGLYVLALIELARQLQEQEGQADQEVEAAQVARKEAGHE